MIPQQSGFLRPSSGLNFVFDGNSLVAGVGATVGTFPSRTMASGALGGSGATYTNCGVSGQTWRMMNGLDSGSSADVDAAWISGKYNVLVCWETTNAVTVGGRTAAQAYADCVAYIAARKAAHAWRVILVTTLPRSNAGVDPVLRAWDDMARANYREMGGDLLVDLRRPGSVFDFAGENSGGFTSQQSYFAEQAAEWVHLSDKGYQLVADWVAAAARRLPKKAPT